MPLACLTWRHPPDDPNPHVRRCGRCSATAKGGSGTPPRKRSCTCLCRRRLAVAADAARSVRGTVSDRRARRQALSHPSSALLQVQAARASITDTSNLTPLMNGRPRAAGGRRRGRRRASTVWPSWGISTALPLVLRRNRRPRRWARRLRRAAAPPATTTRPLRRRRGCERRPRPPTRPRPRPRRRDAAAATAAGRLRGWRRRSVARGYD